MRRNGHTFHSLFSVVTLRDCLDMLPKVIQENLSQEPLKLAKWHEQRTQGVGGIFHKRGALQSDTRKATDPLMTRSLYSVISTQIHSPV